MSDIETGVLAQVTFNPAEIYEVCIALSQWRQTLGTANYSPETHDRFKAASSAMDKSQRVKEAMGRALQMGQPKT